MTELIERLKDKLVPVEEVLTEVVQDRITFITLVHHCTRDFGVVSSECRTTLPLDSCNQEPYKRRILIKAGEKANFLKGSWVMNPKLIVVENLDKDKPVILSLKGDARLIIPASASIPFFPEDPSEMSLTCDNDCWVNLLVIGH
jgi:hypothetical protein